MQYIIVTGNPVDGFSFIGPIVDRDDAVGFAEGYVDPEWWVAEMYPLAARETGEPSQTYEVRPCIEDESGVTECEENVADFWGVYERPVVGGVGCLATWVADFARKEDALWFSENMRSQT